MSLVVVSCAGLLLFLWPFSGHTLPETPAVAVACATVAALVIIESVARRLDSRGITLLASIAAIDAGLRLLFVTGIEGFSPIFFLILCAGYVYGPTYGFLTGAVSLLVSAIVTGGVGPWLPYQLFAAGWVGAGAGLFARRISTTPGRRDVVTLAIIGVIAGYAYGVVMDLWDYPNFRGAPGLGFEPGITIVETVRRFATFYLSTSAVYDTFRAVGNAVMVVAFAKPVLLTLGRLQARHTVEIVAPGEV